MTRNKHPWVVAFSVLIVPPITALGAERTTAVARVEGSWLYHYHDHLTSDLVVFDFAKQKDGTTVAVVEVPALRKKMEFNAVAIEGGKARIKVDDALTIFEGQVGSDGAFMDGKMRVGDGWQPIQLQRVDKRPQFPRPQDPVKPYPYDEEAVTVRNAEAGVTLSGTLTFPRGASAPYPAVVLMSGSGPDERDYLVGGHYWFRVLADHLTRRGIAVLRYDDRGVGKSTGSFRQATTADLAQDAGAAVAYLKGRPEIDARRIGLLGHSDGGIGAALLQGQMPDIAFLVLLGTPGVPGDQLMLRQVEQGLKALGANEDRVLWNVGVQKRMINVLKLEPDAAAIDTALRQLIVEVNDQLTDEARQRMGFPKGFKLPGVVGSSAWLRYLATHDPRPSLAKVRCPVLALNGDRDLLVWSKDNVSAIEQALKSGGNPDYTVKELPGLNHFFQPCRVGSPFEYVLIEETIAPAALELIGDWITRRVAQVR